MGPEFRPLLNPKNSKLVQDIPEGLSPEKLDGELHKRLYQLETKVQRNAQQQKAEPAKDPAR